MKARVYYRGMWFGEVYSDWPLYGKCWQDVTEPCFTKIGAILALKLWIRRNSVYYVEIK